MRVCWAGFFYLAFVVRFLCSLQCISFCICLRAFWFCACFDLRVVFSAFVWGCALAFRRLFGGAVCLFRVRLGARFVLSVFVLALIHLSEPTR